MADGGLLADARIPREELDAGNKRRQLLVGAVKTPRKTSGDNRQAVLGNFASKLDRLSYHSPRTRHCTPPDRAICFYHELQSASLATNFLIYTL